MKRSKVTDSQIAFILRQAEEGTPVAEVCRKAGIFEATYYNWRKKYGGLMPSEMKRLKQLEEENSNLMADASEQLGYQAEAGTWRGWYMSAAKDLREGVKPMPVAVFASPDTVAAMPLELFFDYLSIRFDGPRAEGKTIKLNLDLPDTEQKYLLVVQYGVLQYHKDQQADDADVSLTLDRTTLNDVIGGQMKIEQGVTSGKIQLDGDPQKFEEFVSLLDTFDPWYQVVMPIGTE